MIEHNYDLHDVQILNLVDGSDVNVLFRSHETTYLLKKFSNVYEWSKEQVLLEIEVLDYLRGVNVLTPTIIKSKQKQFLTTWGNCNFILFKGINGSNNYLLDNMTLFQLGQILANMHLRLDERFLDLKTKNIYDSFHITKSPFLSIRTKIEKNESFKELERIVNLLEDEIKLLPKTQPIFGLCHGDYHHKNIMLEGDQKYVIDFDFCGVGYRIMDIATFLLGLLNERHAFDSWEAFVKGYTSTRPLTELEVSLLPSMMSSRYLWWLAFHKQNWGRWNFKWLDDSFFDNGVTTFLDIYHCRI